MHCKNCGTENRDGAKYCCRCGKPITETSLTNRRHASLRVVVGAGIAALLFCAGILVVGRIALFGGANEREIRESFNHCERLADIIDTIDDQYLDQEGYCEVTSIERLLDNLEDELEGCGDFVSDVYRDDNSITVQLQDGILYTYCPPAKGVLSGSEGGTIVTFETSWSETSDDSNRAFRTPLELDGYEDASLWDGIADYVAQTVPGYEYSPDFNINDQQVDLDAIRSIANHALVIFIGHGSWDPIVGSSLNTGIPFTWDFFYEHYKEFLSLELTAGEKVSVTPRFFDSEENFADGSLEGTNIILCSCLSLRDNRLADSLISKGASTVTGFNRTVTYQYAGEMLIGLFGVSEDIDGLTDADASGQYLTFSEALANAKERFGDVDRHENIEWPWEHAAECITYPEDMAETTRLHTVLMAYLDGDKDAAVEFIQTWYNDWTFENGHDVQNAQPAILRCPPLIAEDSELFDEFIDSCNSMTGKYSRDFASCVVSTPQVEELDNGTFRVTVRYIGVQNTVDQAMYDRLIASPNEDVWDVTVGKDNKVTSLTKVEIDNSPSGEGATTVASGKTANGTYILSGTVHMHEEDFGGQRTDSVVSIVLDEDVPYEYEYKGTVQAVAHDVLLATTGAETFGADRYEEWAQYDGQHITVECDGLQGAYHDASYWNVDTLATGKIWLLNSSSQATFHVEDYYKQIERQSQEPVV